MCIRDSINVGGRITRGSFQYTLQDPNFAELTVWSQKMLDKLKTLPQLADVSTDAMHPLATGVSELDRVMGGGVVAGSVTLLFGPPGIGKSTLLFQVLSSLAATGLDVMLASAEESLAQVRGRASRIGAVPRSLLAIEGPDVEAIEAAVERHRPALVVVDSLQSVSDPELGQPAGSLAQVRTCVERLTLSLIHI